MVWPARSHPPVWLPLALGRPRCGAPATRSGPRWAAGATRATAESPTIQQQVVHRVWMRTCDAVLCSRSRLASLAPHTSLLSNLSLLFRAPPTSSTRRSADYTQLRRLTPPPFSNGVAVLPQRPLGEVVHRVEAMPRPAPLRDRVLASEGPRSLLAGRA